MLQIKDLYITHRKDLHTVLEGFSLTLNPGDKCAVIGEEGNGKSTLLKWIYDPALVDAYADAYGERVISGERIAYLPQELAEEDRHRSLYEFFSEEPAFAEMDPGRLARLAKPFGLESGFFYGDQVMCTLSGGEKIKAQIMRLFMKEPTLLLLDEPSNDIDIQTLEWLERMINDFRGTVLFISHDETLLENTANCLVHLELLHRKQESRYTIARCGYREYAEKRRQGIEKQAQQAKSDMREKRIRDEKFRRIQQSVEYAQDTITRQDPSTGRLLKKKMKAVKSLEKRFEKEDEKMTKKPIEEWAINFKLGGTDPVMPAGKTVLDLDVPKLYADDDRLLSQNVRLIVKGPEKICITGRNGCGKTTLMRLIAAELTARRDIRTEYMPQNYEELLDMDRTPVELICRTGEEEERKTVRNWLAALRFTAAEMEHPARELSGGQKAKIFLLRMNTGNANVLLLDEPTRNFSPLSGPVIRSMLSAFPGTVISVSHDRKFIEEVCGTVYELREDGLNRIVWK